MYVCINMFVIDIYIYVYIYVYIDTHVCIVIVIDMLQKKNLGCFFCLVTDEM